MVRASAVLRRLSVEMGLESAIKLADLQAKWQDIFDDRLLGHMYPFEIRDDVLVVYVDSPVWLQELTYLKNDIFNRLDGFSLRDITLKLGKIPRHEGAPKIPVPDKAPEAPLMETPSWAIEDLEQIYDKELRRQLEYIINKVTAQEV